MKEQLAEGKQSQVHEQMHQLRKEIETAGQQIGELFERLQPILPLETGETDSAIVEKVELVPLAEDIRQLEFLLADEVVARLHYILKSLEI
jgi:hypothetical protein